MVVKSLSFGKITKYHQNLWGISANANNYFGLFATHFFLQILGKSKKDKKAMKKHTSNPKKKSRKTTNQMPVFLTINNKNYTTQKGQTQPTKSCLADKGQQRPKTTKTVKFTNN